MFIQNNLMINTTTDVQVRIPEKYKDLAEVFWSPAVRWEKKQDEIRIEIFSYKGYVSELFPKFYFLTQKGIEFKKIFDAFPEADPDDLVNFLDDLLKKKILITTIMTPTEIFYPQGYLFKNEYSEAIKFDANALKAFKNKQLTRCCFDNPDNNISMKCNEDFPDTILKRQSYRTFKTDEPIQFEIFKKLLSCFRQITVNNEIRYYYASGGGLYPIDIYLYIKQDRVQNLKKGLYYYNPMENTITAIDNECEISKDAHYFTNQEIYSSSAVSLFFIYNAEVTMPKYGGLGYAYGYIDTGLMLGVLTTIAEMNHIGLCSIGEMNFKKIQKYFSLNKNQVWIHTVELGIKPE